MIKFALLDLLCSLVLLTLMGCSGLEQSEQDKLRRMNAKGEFIYRRHDENFYSPSIPKHRVREKYSWEEEVASSHYPITKELFRCQGSPLNPACINHQNPNRGLLFDCTGKEKHSLPMRDHQEFIYPVLLDILNYLQIKTGKAIVVTCGYRCPTHNAYADGSFANQSSKHMIGAEVDFYIEGMQDTPQAVVEEIFDFYRQTPGYKGIREYEKFQRFGGKTNVSSPPWYNKEILIKIFKKEEGRDFDNRHPFPYLSIQVLFDRDKNEEVVYDWQTAFNGYCKY